MANNLATLPAQALSIEEKAGLMHMVQEEKLARDVYMALFAQWNLRAFANISNSEQTHMNAVRALFAKYGLVDPTANKAPGEFADPEFQNLYRELTAKGAASLSAALEVGAVIEDLDIKDLDDALTKTDNLDIRLVYGNLAKGSRNHMRTFYAQLSRQGQTYTAQYISPDQLKQILYTPRERGMRY